MTQERFLEKARLVHGDRYDYSKVVYRGCNEEIIVIDNNTGEEKMVKPKHFLYIDNRYVKKTNKEKADIFIKKSKEKFGDRYDYSKVEYVNSKTPVTLICKEHGEFTVDMYQHLYSKDGYCSKKSEFDEVKRSKKIKPMLTKEERKEIRKKRFIESAIKKFGNRFDYSIVRYVDCKTLVNIIDKESNNEIFSITPQCFLNSKEGRSRKMIFTTERFIEKARKIHGDKYDYSKVEYKHNKKNVCIICPIHGEFWQTPHEHLKGCGCPKCSNAVSKLEESVINRLTEEKIKFKTQYTNKKIFGKMRGDFFINSYNVMIECQGKQHFDEENSFHRAYGGSLSKQIERDYNFNKCCKDADIKLLYYFNEENAKGVDYLNDEKFNGIYTERNTFTDMNSLILCIKNR